ncbi:secondary carrier transporter [Lithospermum erythrorhizon]|uniref:Secondary carrier transporter n=1 Tax=Lithospermum erythrorhizon TaxID=34254 RepID=A0AAV3QTV6_LITER
MEYAEYKEPIPILDRSKSIGTIALVATIAAAVQYGWALQLSLLSPYIQLLGVPHGWVALVWLCGPISGLIVQPTVGVSSDRCTSRFGRRRPYIVGGGILLLFGVFLIGFAADIGGALGDSLVSGTKPIAITVFVLGFFILDISNNLIQSPCRALLADLSGESEAKITYANALFAFFMAMGNILGYGAGSFKDLYKMLPFTRTNVCDVQCANLKTCCILSGFITSICISFVASMVKEERLDPLLLAQKDAMAGERSPSIINQLTFSIKNLSKPMWNLIFVTSLNWIAWFPFLMYDTDWMGKEIYGGNVKGNPEEVERYYKGVRVGTAALMLYILTLAIMSLAMNVIIKLLGGVTRLWGFGNFILATCMASTALITKIASDARLTNLNNGHQIGSPSLGVKVSAFTLFAALGLPQAVTYCIPYALASIYTNTSDSGQGVALGLLNLAIVIPQMFVAFVIGPLDAAFKGSNLPGFIMGAVAAALSGIFSSSILKV